MIGEVLQRTRSGECHTAFIPGEAHTGFIPLILILILIHAMCIPNLAELLPITTDQDLRISS